MIRADCRHFPGDRPCVFHKRRGVVCADCEFYQPRGTAVLIIKLEALGDVLRTTSVLPSLKREHGDCHITWITTPPAEDLFVGNDMVDHVVCSADDYVPMLLSRHFDIVINPDASARSCELASIARADRTLGFGLSPRGHVVPLGPAASSWLEIGGSDYAKRSNTKTYQQVLHEMCELDPAGHRIVLGLTQGEEASRDRLAAAVGVDPGRPVIALNTGAGGRWELKKWRIEGFIELIDMVLDSTDAQVVLLGGEVEGPRKASIRSHFGSRVRSPETPTLRHLIRIVDLCDAVVTGDTLCLHVALGLEKRVVALFGPTSSHEIELYGLGRKIVPDTECACCYRTRCDKSPNCMDLISADEVFRHLMDEVSLLQSEDKHEGCAGELVAGGVSQAK
jgi:heptosyltransferase-2